jgi:hypothetical protein
MVESRNTPLIKPSLSQKGSHLSNCSLDSVNKSSKQKEKKQKKYIGGKFYGEGASGAILGLPRAPFSKKYDFSVSLNIKKNNTSNLSKAIRNKTYTFNFVPKNNNKENYETIEELIQNQHKVSGKLQSSVAPHPGQALLETNVLNQVSKFFFKDIAFLYEANRYINIFKHIFTILSTEDMYKYFNLPINLGIINKDLMCDSKYNAIYNKNWLGILENQNNKNSMKESGKSGIKTFKQILDSYSPYQITFLMGESLLNISLELFYQKYINILESVKLLNEKKIIFDDFKLDNLIFVNDTIKQSDFSSILKFNQISLNSLPHTILQQYFYESYNPLLMILLKYYLYQREGSQKTLEEIYNEVIEYKELTKKFVNNFNNNVFQRVQLLVKNINLDLKLSFDDNIYEIKEINNSISSEGSNKVFSNVDLLTSSNTSSIPQSSVRPSNVAGVKNKRKISKSKIIMSIKEILINLINNREMDKESTLKILSNLIFYFDKKNQTQSLSQAPDFNSIINDILRRINIYSTGYIIFDFLSEKIDNNKIETEYDKEILYNLLLISFLCCNQIIIGINNIYIQEPDIDILLKKYGKYLSKKRERNNK